VAISNSSAVTGVADPVKYPALPGTATYQLPVEGASPAGGTRPAIGARVILTTTLAAGRDTMRYATEAVVGPLGRAEVQLIPGVLDSNRGYSVTVLPTPSSELGARWDGTVTLGPGAAGVLVLPAISLPRRVLVSGFVHDHLGRGAAGVTVTPALAASFLAATTPEALDAAHADRLQLPQTVTLASGAFMFYLDAVVAGKPAVYDLELVPPNASALPRWSTDEVAVSGERVDVPRVDLPAAALISGIVKTEDGRNVVPGAVVQVYMRVDGGPARPRALATSDAQGKISLVLPSR
jgi:hypothetical protein